MKPKTFDDPFKSLSSDIVRVYEVKECSPFGWSSTLSRLEMLHIAEAGDIVSIHTNPLWGGSWAWLEEARKLTHKPILAKGFHNTIHDVNRAFDCGADYVLTVGWWPGDARCWHECECLHELRESSAEMAVWNSRNPRNGSIRSETIHQAINVRSGKICQASNLTNYRDIANVAAILVGAGLYAQV